MPGLEQTVWDYIAIAMCGVGLIPVTLFLFEFQRRTKGDWRNNPFGRYLMLTMFLKGCLFTLAVVNRVFAGWWGQEPVTTLVLASFVLSLFLPYRLLLEAQRERAETEKGSNR